MVTKHTKDTQYCLNVNASFVDLIALISMSPSPSGERAGRYETNSKSQIRMMEMADTGSATANQESHPMGGSIA